MKRFRRWLRLTLARRVANAAPIFGGPFDGEWLPRALASYDNPHFCLDGGRYAYCDAHQRFEWHAHPAYALTDQQAERILRTLFDSHHGRDDA